MAYTNITVQTVKLRTARKLIKALEKENERLRKQSDLLTLGLLQEKDKVRNLQIEDNRYRKALQIIAHEKGTWLSFVNLASEALKLPRGFKLCICCEEMTEENAHLHRNCGK